MPRKSDTGIWQKWAEREREGERKRRINLTIGNNYWLWADSVTHQFVREDTLEEASSVSQHDEEKSLRLLPQVMHPPTDLDPLVTVLQGVANLDLKENGTCTYIYTCTCAGAHGRGNLLSCG